MTVNESGRLVRKLSDVVEEVRLDLEANFGITQEQLTAFRARVNANGFDFAKGSNFIDSDEVFLDYEVQRAAISKHILNIVKARSKASRKACPSLR